MGGTIRGSAANGNTAENIATGLSIVRRAILYEVWYGMEPLTVHGQ
jgi:hypothetical protein